MIFKNLTSFMTVSIDPVLFAHIPDCKLSLWGKGVLDFDSELVTDPF